MHCKKILVKRIIEPGNRHYTYGIFEASRGYGDRVMTGVIDGTRKDADAFERAPLTESGRTRKGFKNTTPKQKKG